MAKVKNKKRVSSETMAKKKESKAKSLNPFEIHINKEKMKVIGRKLKNDKGLPGVARAKALKKRKNTLQREYSIQHKSNQFMDKRIGERNSEMSSVDKAVARFTAERIKLHKKKSIFNLADDEVLTHRGQTLSEIEKFDDPRSDDDDDEDDETRNKSGKLDTNFVEEAHFGGGMFRKTGIEGAKSHKDIIDELIAESKKRKAEKQKLKEATLDLTEQLDTEWKDLLPIVKSSKKDSELKPKADDYDKMVRELKFAARGIPSDRLKTEEEIAKEEKERLEKLEQERLSRMNGGMEEKVTKYRSADDLEDNFAYDSDPDILLSYNEAGSSNVEVDYSITRKGTENTADDEDSAEESEDDNEESENNDEGSDNDDEESNNEDENNTSYEKGDNEESENDEGIENDNSDDNIENNALSSAENKNKKSINKNVSINKKSNEESESEESEDDLEDLKAESSESEDDVAIPVKSHNKLKTMKRKLEETTQCTKEDNHTPHPKADEPSKKLKHDTFRDKTVDNLPFTFTIPESYEELQSLLSDKSSEAQAVIMERMIKCNHPGANPGNKEKLDVLFVYVLQYINDISTDEDVKKSFETFFKLLPWIFDLAQFNKENTHKSILEVIKEKQEEYRKFPKRFPGIDVLLFLKLVGCIFTTSDFRHQVVTPSIIFMEQMLYWCKVKTARDVTYGLFLVALVLEYTVLSKRFLPSSIVFLSKVLKCSGLRPKVPNDKFNVDLYLNSDCSMGTYSLKICCSKLAVNQAVLKTSRIESFSNELKIQCIYTALKLVEDYIEIFKVLPSARVIFSSIGDYIQNIPMENCPKPVQDQIVQTNRSLDSLKEIKLDYIVMEQKRPKALRLYEPNIQKVYDGKTHKVQSKEKAERDKLLHKLKREKKGALREIRRDRSFLGKLKISEKIRSDVERKVKVRKIMAEANVQQSELNAIDRKKKKK